MVVSENDIAPDIPGIQTVWIQEWAAALASPTSTECGGGQRLRGPRAWSSALSLTA